jgi:hypothetical protein
MLYSFEGERKDKTKWINNNNNNNNPFCFETHVINLF